MTVQHGIACVVFLLLFTSSLSAQADKQSPLHENDEKLLRSLLKDFLFAPPADATRVKVRFEAPGWWEKAKEERREGWLVHEKLDDRVYFTDREWVHAPAKEKMEQIDFMSKWSNAHMGKPVPKVDAIGFFPGHEERPAGDRGDEPTLVIAAWLYHLGKTDLAAKVMAFAPLDRAQDVAILKKWLARNAFHRALRCYGQYEDQSALEHAERLLSLFPAEAKQIEQAIPLAEDLRRREQRGLMGAKADAELPADYSKWSREAKFAHLIHVLDRTPERLPNTPSYSSHGIKVPVQVRALIELGESSIPGLLDVIEKDERLTRCVIAQSKWQEIGNVQTVREVAHFAICKILRTRYLDPHDPEPDETGFRKPDFKKLVPAARAYWKEFGPLPFEARMMRVLIDPNASFPALREAATKISVAPGQPEFSWSTDIESVQPNPLVLKFTQPSAAEAVLAAMDRELAHDDAGPQADHNRAYTEPVYFAALIRLGDERISAELAKRAAKEANALMRVRYAHASFRLGDSQALLDFASDFGAGKIMLRTDKDALRWQLERIVEHLTVVKLKEADDALYKLAEPEHRYHQDVLNAIVNHIGDYRTASDLVRHPSCIGVLRKMLDDTTPTPVRLSYRDGESPSIAFTGSGSSGLSTAPAILHDPKVRRASAIVRHCDLAGQECNSFAGLPAFHPLFQDVDARLAALREAIDKYPGKYRAITRAEAFAITAHKNNASFVPEIPALGRPATATDVKAGKAIFHFDGKGTLPKLDLPALGTWPKIGNDKTARTCLIVQAETQAGGDIIYGVIERHAIRTVASGEFAEVTPLSKVKVETKKVK